jgi:hypothetical protein
MNDQGVSDMRRAEMPDQIAAEPKNDADPDDRHNSQEVIAVSWVVGRERRPWAGRCVGGHLSRHVVASSA